MKPAGIALLILGLLLTVFTSFSFFTKENVVEIGDVKITKDEPHYITWPRIAGVAIMGAGVVLLWQSKKKQ